MKRNLLLIILTASMNIHSQGIAIPYAETDKLSLCEEWDKTFPRSQRVTHKKVVFANKELLLIPNAVHTDLYDRTDIIPFDQTVSFLKR